MPVVVDHKRVSDGEQVWHMAAIGADDRGNFQPTRIGFNRLIEWECNGSNPARLRQVRPCVSASLAGSLNP
jgi:hypothetical protein